MLIPLVPLRKHCGVLLFVLAGLIGTSLGCSSSEHDSMMDTTSMLEQYEKDRRRHDPQHFSEVDLGEYTISLREEPSIFYVRFHLWGVLPDGLNEEFSKLYPTRTETLRGKVIEVTTQCKPDELNDPLLARLKSELIPSINRVLQAPLLRDVVFADFSFERG